MFKQHDFIVGSPVVLPEDGQPQRENEVEDSCGILLKAFEESALQAGVPGHLAIALGQAFVAQRVAASRTRPEVARFRGTQRRRPSIPDRRREPAPKKLRCRDRCPSRPRPPGLFRQSAQLRTTF